jgi:hypothetical protein
MGRRFGLLIVSSFSHRNKRGQSYWKCLCDCGNEGIIRQGHLLSGNTKSCGCERQRLSSLRMKGKTCSSENKRKISGTMRKKYATGELTSPMKNPKIAAKHSETKKRMFANGELVNPMKYPGVAAKFSERVKGENNPFYGRTHLDETKQKISISMVGEKNPNWNGGTSFEPYSVDWTQTLRRTVRERDNYTCQLCKKAQEDRTFDCHHIDYNKKNCCPENLITLCRRCHISTNQFRSFWMFVLK